VRAIVERQDDRDRLGRFFLLRLTRISGIDRGQGLRLPTGRHRAATRRHLLGRSCYSPYRFGTVLGSLVITPANFFIPIYVAHVDSDPLANA
jgi:hypothetical protein